MWLRRTGTRQNVDIASDFFNSFDLGSISTVLSQAAANFSSIASTFQSTVVEPATEQIGNLTSSGLASLNNTFPFNSVRNGPLHRVCRRRQRSDGRALAGAVFHVRLSRATD